MIWACTLAWLALAALSPVEAATINDVKVGAQGVALYFDGPIDGASSFVLNGSARLVVDIAGATPGNDAPSGGLVVHTRQGQYNPTTARVVFDLAQPAVVDGGAISSDGRRLLLSLRPVGAGGFAQAVRAPRRSFAVPQAGPSAGFQPAVYSDPAPAFSPASGVTDRGSVAATPVAAQFRSDLPVIPGSVRGRRPLVVIDPGHGGHDTGALSTVYGNRREKDLTLAIALAIRDALQESGRVRVILTRTDDRFLVLGDRVEIARRLHADLFISIHADSSPTGETAHGATVYTLSEVASDKVAAQIAASENKADVINGVDLGAQNSDVSSILVDLTQRETMNVSSAFAALLQREMSPTIGFTSNFHRFAGFRVLKAPDTPSVLLETGYLTNPTDAHFLFSKEGQHKIAEGVRRAVEAHFARRLARLEGRNPS